MHLVAVTQCPQGQHPGELFEATPEAGAILILVGSAREATEDDIKRSRSRRGRGYQRRDLTASEG